MPSHVFDGVDEGLCVIASTHGGLFVVVALEVSEVLPHMVLGVGFKGVCHTRTREGVAYDVDESVSLIRGIGFGS